MANNWEPHPVYPGDPPLARRHPLRVGKFTPDIKHRILVAIRGGNHYPAAAEYAGITYGTFRAWMIHGERAASCDPDTLSEDDFDYVDFWMDVKEAEASAEVVAVTKWRGAFDKDWKAARDWLGRRHPDRWGPRVEVQVSQKDEEILELLDALDTPSREIVNVPSVPVQELEPPKSPDAGT